MFGDWFVRTFPDPQTWFMARLNYARTTAVMSMVSIFKLYRALLKGGHQFACLPQARPSISGEKQQELNSQNPGPIF